MAVRADQESASDQEKAWRTVSTHVRAEENKALVELCRRSGTTRYAVLQRAVRAYLDAAAKTLPH